MHCGMATRRPAGAITDEIGMVLVADADDSGRRLNLGVASQAEIGIGLGEHFGVDRAVRIVAGRAALAHRGVLIHHRFGLLPVALGARFIQSRHRQTPGGFHDVHAVGVMALDAVHLAFDDRMMLGKMEFRARGQVALEAAFRVLAGIDDEFLAATAARHRDVFAGGSVAGFAAVLAGHLGFVQMQPRVRAGGEGTRNVRVTIHAGFVPRESRPFDLRNRGQDIVRGGAGIERQNQGKGCRAQSDPGEPATALYLAFSHAVPIWRVVILSMTRQAA